ncbi:cytochrome b-c1 complex subunit 7 [Moniliophthora roreri MCA 2997]|uniref:Cytochrome b-c1 complex subunit 7 n=2 Tax=Moniliophthora roreri TaxID=221103 RepID=V2WWD1_MONRO|nr:cytochrome b-c1 complex subunit 7 [Moniliophthora roreri MCA 2997]KAI3610781.1 cytochrome b-c1 complex subunit 7 [Moniliophthora roreri]
MTIFGPLSVSLASQIRASKTLSAWFIPVANWYANAMRYRQFGLRYDDLLLEERDDVQRAIGRLTPQESYDRAFRFKRASQASALHKPLPKEQWTKPEDDIRYLTPHITAVAKEDAERKMWDTIAVKRK